MARLFSLLPECVAMASKDEGGKQYFIAVVPPQPVYDDAQRLKEYFRDSYGSKAALNSPPHITLHMPFLWKESREDRLTHALSRFAGDNGPVKICLDGFSCFRPRAQSACINVCDLREVEKNSGFSFFNEATD